MAVNVASLAQASPPRTKPTRDPPRALALSAVLTVVFGVLLARGAASVQDTFVREWKALIFWATLIVLLSCLPISVDNEARLTLDDPLLLAMAFLYPPETAALVAFLASFDLREISRDVALTRAIFNRVQIGLSVYLAGAMFRFVTGGNLEPWQIAALGTAGAVAAEYLANVLLVSVHARALWRLDLRTALRRLNVGRAGQFLATHLGYGLLALVLTHLFRDVGAWSVAIFLVPILVARQMLIRGLAIGALKEQLRRRERLLEKLSDRILDERRDERLRLAGDLHDDLLQALTKLWLSSRTLSRQLEDVGYVAEDLAELVKGTDASIEALRRVIHGLRDPSLGWGGLLPNLESLVRELRLEWKTRILLSVPYQLELAPSMQFTAYQVVREALTNSLKHADASLIAVSVETTQGELIVKVKDDGVGFIPEAVDSSTHFGLGLIRERVQAAGGSVTIQSGDRRGTTIQASFPLNSPSRS